MIGLLINLSSLDKVPGGICSLTCAEKDNLLFYLSHMVILDGTISPSALYVTTRGFEYVPGKDPRQSKAVGEVVKVTGVTYINGQLFQQHKLYTRLFLVVLPEECSFNTDGVLHNNYIGKPITISKVTSKCISLFY